ncbi:MAG TPA: PIG-L family deacetylase [Streptosporangiaceae bacterium]|nr:PIG-L family deacetylase [Streptosporangiaceae bacterium]
MKIAVSSHLDDAALSASAALGAQDATVATVFTALPAAGRPVSWWDRLTGATDSVQRQRDRLAEDAAAMRLLSASPVHLGASEAQYRDADPELGPVIERLTDLMAGAGEVWLPSAIGGHRDHRLARDAGLRAAAGAGHGEVMLYADFPYVIAYGWPDWVSGRPAPAYLDASFWLASEIAATGLDANRLTPVVTRLSAAQRVLKAQIIAAYASQAAALKLTPADLAGDPGKLDFELAWRMPLTWQALS